MIIRLFPINFLLIEVVKFMKCFSLIMVQLKIDSSWLKYFAINYSHFHKPVILFVFLHWVESLKSVVLLILLLL